MNKLHRTRFAALCCVVALVGICLSGCYTRLTTPKEAINYVDPDGNPIREIQPYAIKAPDYNVWLRQKAADGVNVESQYRLQPGTRVQVEVYGHGIEKTVNIRPDGFIDLPLVGDVQAGGRTITGLKNEISDRYKEFFVDPPQVILNTDVTENQEEVKAGDVAVLNPTGNSGVINLTGDEYLSEVLAQARALHPKAEWNEIAVIRRGRIADERYVIICDVGRLLHYGEVDQDVRMRNGDIVFVPHEKNTILEEILASFSVFAGWISDADTVTSYIEKIEGY